MHRYLTRAQRAAICNVLCNPIAEKLWSESGPSKEAQKLYQGAGASLDENHRVLLSVAFAIWRDDVKGPPLTHLRCLSSASLAHVGQLLEALATGSEAVDAWVRKMTLARCDSLAFELDRESENIRRWLVSTALYWRRQWRTSRASSIVTAVHWSTARVAYEEALTSLRRFKTQRQRWGRS